MTRTDADFSYPGVSKGGGLGTRRIWHMNNFLVTLVTDPPGPAVLPDENVYVPWLPHTAHKL